MAVGSFRRLEEVGRGSFATVYKGSMSVSSCQVSFGISPLAIWGIYRYRVFQASSVVAQCWYFHLLERVMLTSTGMAEEAWLCRHQVC